MPYLLIFGIGYAAVRSIDTLDTLLTIMGLCGLTLMVLWLIQTALEAIYHVAVYRFAVDGQTPADFDDDLISQAFRQKRKQQLFS
mgnify:CR=1 FL=1